MSKYTLICFVSNTRPDAPVRHFESDLGVFSGVQTNAVPTCYAIKKLMGEKRGGNAFAAVAPSLSRILAIVTEKTNKNDGSNYAGFRDEVVSYCKLNKLTPPVFEVIPIKDSSTQGDILNELIKRLQSDGPSSVIIETTGGMRPVVTAFSLLARFLHAKGTDVKFSTYADTNTEKVGITQDYQMYDLLEAISAFVDTGNEKELNAISGQLDIPRNIRLFEAMRRFRSSILVCNIRTLEDNIIALQKAFEMLKASTSVANTPNSVVFRHLLLEMIESKMSFINSKSPLVEVVQWCVDNWYLQQAVTVLYEKMLKGGGHKAYGVTYKNLQIIRCLRNSLNHAEGVAVDEYNSIPEDIRDEVTAIVDGLLNDQSDAGNSNLDSIKGFINEKLATMRSKTRENL